ncbi:MAG: hypothetical protein AAGL98_10395, partial [Planctomycetota bacterium]
MALRLQPGTGIVRPALVGLLLCLLVSGATAAWIIKADAPTRLAFTGDVQTRAGERSLNVRANGLVTEIPAQTGARFKAGDLLLALDDTAARAQFDLASERIVQAELRQARLLAELEEADAVERPTLSASISPEDLAELEARELALLRSRAQTLTVQRDVFEAERRSLREAKRVDPEGVDLEGGLSTLASNLAEVEGAHRARIVEELEDIQGQIAGDLEPSLNAAKAALEDTALKAPEDLIVTGVLLAGPGSVASEGSAAITFAPLKEGLVLTMEASPELRARLSDGPPLTVRIDGLGTEFQARASSNLADGRVELTPLADAASVLERPELSPGQALTATVEFPSDAILAALLMPLRGLTF